MKAIQNPNAFYSKNYLNENCQIDVDNNLAINEKTLFDFNPYKDDNILISDTRQVSFSIWFKDDFGQFVTREISTIILQNINWRSFKISAIMPDNSETQIVYLTENYEKDLVINIPNPVTAGKISITINDIQEQNDDVVRIGQMRICKFIMDLKATTKTEVQPVVDDGDLRTFNGTLASWTNFEKWGARITIENIKKEQLDLLKSFIKEDGYITIIPWYDFEPKDIYECLIKRGVIGTYAVNRWSGLISQSLQLEAKENAVN